MALRNQPYIPLYVQDFMSDEKLLQCSAQSTGVYIRIMCLMHKSDQYGTVRLKDKHKTSDDFCLNFANYFAKVLPYDLQTIVSSIIELIEEGVLVISGDVMYQKRMVKDNSISEIRAKSGAKGGKNKNLFALAKDEAKIKQNTESESEYEIEIVNNKNGVEFFEKCLNDEGWKESLMRATGIQTPGEWITKFNDHVTSTEETYPRLADYRRHCTHWVKLELEKIKNGKPKSKQPATIDQVAAAFSTPPVFVNLGDFSNVSRRKDQGSE